MLFPSFPLQSCRRILHSYTVLGNTRTIKSCTCVLQYIFSLSFTFPQLCQSHLVDGHTRWPVLSSYPIVYHRILFILLSHHLTVHSALSLVISITFHCQDTQSWHIPAQSTSSPCFPTVQTLFILH